VITVSSLAIQMGSFSLKNISFEIPDGGYAALMGRTGAGKTTILEAICGLRSVVSGTIELAGRDVTSLKPAERGIGYVPQDGALFSTMSIRDHLAFSLVVRKWSKSAIDSRVSELVELLGIAHLLDRKPAGLSGGEEQRVSLGRALAFRPAILCLDEPLSALDDQTRAEMYELLAHVRQHTGVTTLHITHNQSEAASLADQLLVLEDGQITSRPNA
jgi:molybdate/tungstate transport system ATP-binding protein